MKYFDYMVLNAFGSKPFHGNPAAVFPDASGLASSEMQTIARQLNLVETVFVTYPNQPDVDARLRYFTPSQELPFAGHPTIAAWIGLVRSGKFNLDEKQEFVQQTAKGLSKIYLSKYKADVTARMDMQSPAFTSVTESSKDITEAFSLPAEALSTSQLPEGADLGLITLVLELKNLNFLKAAKLNPEPFMKLCSQYNFSQAQLFTFETNSPENHIHTRNICMKESAGSSEDPACGTGTAAIMAYLMKNYPDYSGNSVTLRAEQGEVVRKPSLIICHGTTTTSGKIGVQISGPAVLMQEGRFYL